MSYRTYKTFNPDAFIADLQTMPQTNINTTSHTADECLESFPSTFSNIINTHLPHVTKRIKRPKQSPWITKDILLSMNKRDNSKKKHLENEYRYWRNKTTHLIREAKNNFYSESIQTYKNNPKMLASVFKELNHQTKNVVNITSIMYNNTKFTRDADIANILNKHFTSVAEKYLNDTANKSHSPNLIFLK